MTSVMLQAANPIVRAGLESIIRAANLEVVGSVSDIATLLQLLELAQPDVVLLDKLFTDEEPLSEKLLSGLGHTAVVVLADNSDSDWIADALKAGVRAVLPPTATSEEIVATVTAVAANLVVLHPEFVDSLLLVNLASAQPSTPGNSSPAPLLALTPREVEVLGMIAEGLGNKSIARRLHISEHTVKFHISSIFTKLNAKSRTEAVTLGARLGLVML